MTKLNSTNNDDLSYWIVNESVDYITETSVVESYERAITLSVSLLRKALKNGKTKLEPSSCHSNTSNCCACRRSFHLFCTELFDRSDNDFEMIQIHPAPLNHDRAFRRSTPFRPNRKSRQPREVDQETVITARSEPVQLTIADHQALEKKLPIPLKMTTRTSSLNIPSSSTGILAVTQSIPYHRPFPLTTKTPPAVRAVKHTRSLIQLQMRAQTVFDASAYHAQFFLPRGPPPSPKTPTRDPSLYFPSSSSSMSNNPIRNIAIRPELKYAFDPDRSNSKMKSSYQEHAREYLSASDCSDEESDEQEKHDPKSKPLRSRSKFLQRSQAASRTETTNRDRIFSQNQYLSLAEVYYSSLDIYKAINEKSRRHLRSQSRSMIGNHEIDENATMITKTTNAGKSSSFQQTNKSVYGFAKATSSVHFGHAAGRLALQSSFEKWPHPSSRRTPIERKQEVTTLRLVTLPLVTS